MESCVYGFCQTTDSPLLKLHIDLMAQVVYSVTHIRYLCQNEHINQIKEKEQQPTVFSCVLQQNLGVEYSLQDDRKDAQS